MPQPKPLAGILDQLFGANSIRTMVWDRPGAKKLVPKRLDPKTILSVSFDERSNTVILVGPDDKLAMAEEALKTLDMAKGPEPEDIRIFQLTQAPASEVAKAIEQLMPDGNVKAAPTPKGQAKPAASQQAFVRIVPDPIGNRLIVSAPQKQMARVEKTCKHSGRPQPKTARASYRHAENRKGRSDTQFTCETAHQACQPAGN